MIFMGIEKYATLVEQKDNYLQVCVSNKEEADNILKVSLESHHQEIVGYVCFKDERSSINIMGEFLEIYPGGGKLAKHASEEGHEEKFAFVHYPISMKPTLVHAFVNYFSPKKVENYTAF